MNLITFLEHWKLVENPFRAEEARQDPVFTRLESAAIAQEPDAPEPSASNPAAQFLRKAVASTLLSPTTHSEFEKIAGDFDRPSTSIVFGEKGSGKTAIRMQ